MNTLIDIFKTIITISSMTSVVIVVVLLLRFILKKAPKRLVYSLWLIVAIRLIIPVMLPSSISIFNLFDTPVINNNTASHMITSNEIDSEHISQIETNKKTENHIDNGVNNTITNSNTSKHMTDATFTTRENIYSDWTVYKEGICSLPIN